MPRVNSMQETNFFRSMAGDSMYKHLWQKRPFGRVTDPIFNWHLRRSKAFQQMERDAAAMPKRKVLIIGVDVPARSADLDQLFQQLSASHHEVTCAKAPLVAGLGKYQNINRTLAEYDLNQFDWFAAIDDDILIPPHFLDDFLYLAESEKLKICMPAHCFRSYFGFLLTMRQWNSLARETLFVESGPFTAFHRSVFPLCIPFAEVRWAWGTDLAWSQAALDHGERIGIIDACPVRHLRPVASSYSTDKAIEEAEIFLRQAGISRSRTDFLQDVAVLRHVS